MCMKLIVMGVSGCGKSSLGLSLASKWSVPFIEGDDHHGPENIGKMARGEALTDEDRAQWLDRLGALLKAAPDGAVLSCSALKRNYRAKLRAYAPEVKFVFIDISQELALARVKTRSAHFFSADLVASQFQALEAPCEEPGVLRLDATLSPARMEAEVAAWIKAP